MQFNKHTLVLMACGSISDCIEETAAWRRLMHAINNTNMQGLLGVVLVAIARRATTTPSMDHKCAVPRCYRLHNLV